MVGSGRHGTATHGNCGTAEHYRQLSEGRSQVQPAWPAEEPYLGQQTAAGNGACCRLQTVFWNRAAAVLQIGGLAAQSQWARGRAAIPRRWWLRGRVAASQPPTASCQRLCHVLQSASENGLRLLTPKYCESVNQTKRRPTRTIHVSGLLVVLVPVRVLVVGGAAAHVVLLR